MQGNINNRNRNNTFNNNPTSRSTIKSIPRSNGGGVGSGNGNNIISGSVGGRGNSRAFNPLQGKTGFNSNQSSLPSGTSNFNMFSTKNKNKPIGQGTINSIKKNSQSSFTFTKSQQSSVNFYDKYSKNPLSSLVHVKPLTDSNVISRFQRTKNDNNYNNIE